MREARAPLGCRSMNTLARIPSARTDVQVEAARVKAQRKLNAKLGFPDAPIPPCELMPDPERDRARAEQLARGEVAVDMRVWSKEGRANISASVSAANRKRKGCTYKKHGRYGKEGPAVLSPEWIASVHADLARIRERDKAVAAQRKAEEKLLMSPKKNWTGKAPPMAPNLDNLSPAELKKFVTKWRAKEKKLAAKAKAEKAEAKAKAPSPRSGRGRAVYGASRAEKAKPKKRR